MVIFSIASEAVSGRGQYLLMYIYLISICVPRLVLLTDLLMVLKRKGEERFQVT